MFLHFMHQWLSFVAQTSGGTKPTIWIKFRVAQYGSLSFDSAKQVKRCFAFRLFDLKDFPEDGNVHDSLGEVYALMGKLKKSKVHYQKAFAKDSTNMNATEALKHLSW